MLKAILNKGGAGKSISRTETVERLTSLMRRYNDIMYTYDAASGVASDAAAEQLDALGRVVRDDVGKISEMILSAGGVPPTGTDIEPESVSAGATEAEALAALIRLEQAFAEAIAAESKAHHALRAVAALDNTLARTRERLAGLKRIAGSVPAAV